MRQLIKKAIRIATRRIPPYSKVVLLADSANWVIAHEMKELARTISALGGRTAHAKLLPILSNQCVFFGSHFDLLLNPQWFEADHRYATAYFHGRPGSGVAEIDTCYANLQRYHHRIDRIQVSHSAMRGIVLESGIDPDKVFLIPIGINLEYFPEQTERSRINARKALGIPMDAVVLGSFQKDGNGWGEGNEPKLIKGPDIFLKTISILKESIPEMFILLSGPARGYVKNGLEKLGVPYSHIYQKEYMDIGTMFQALDLYLVASREEGGPKAVLESMASGVPLVTTKVGQATDLVKHRENGWVADVEDYEALAFFCKQAFLSGSSTLQSMKLAARRTAEENSYLSQRELWSKFLLGFLDYPN